MHASFNVIFTKYVFALWSSVFRMGRAHKRRAAGHTREGAGSVREVTKPHMNPMHLVHLFLTSGRGQCKILSIVIVSEVKPRQSDLMANKNDEPQHEHTHTHT